MPAALFGLGMLAGTAGTFLILRIARRLGWMDPPNPLVPQHRIPVVRPGGLGLALGASVTAALLAPDTLRTALLPFSYLALGFVDDRLRLRPATKLLLQVTIASLFAVFATPSGMSGWSACLGVLWIVMLVNAFNFLDVCDGLLAGLTALILGFWGLAHPEVALEILPVAGACVGFLIFNWPPAKIFLGDAGSHYLGAVVAMATLRRFAADPSPAPAFEITLVTGIPLFELVFVTWIRIRKRLPWWRGSPDHIALRLQAGGLSRVQADLVVWGAASVLLGTVIALQNASMRMRASLLALILLSGFLAARILARWEVRAPRDGA